VAINVAWKSDCHFNVVTEGGFELKSLNNRLAHQLTDSEPRLYKSVNLHFSIAAHGVTKIQVKTAIENALNKYCHVCLVLQTKILITYTAENIRQ
jgi:putative redox protein